MRFRFAIAYGILLLPSLLVAAMAWSWIAPDRLYHCWDDAPIVAFVPPFVHPEHPLSSTDFDHYIAAKSTVYGVWFGFVALALLFPGLPLWFLWRSYRTHEKRGFLYIPAGTFCETERPVRAPVPDEP